jgi:hypothetical protein
MSVMYEVNQWDENFYMKLGVPRNSARTAYHRAYKEYVVPPAPLLLVTTFIVHNWKALVSFTPSFSMDLF